MSTRFEIRKTRGKSLHLYDYATGVELIMADDEVTQLFDLLGTHLVTEEI